MMPTMVTAVGRRAAGVACALGDRVRLVLLSALMLFVELALIRWAGSNVVYLSYFSNFVLLGSFLGIGVGFLRAKARSDLFAWSIVGLAALVAFVSLFPVKIARSTADILFFGEFTSTGLPAWVTLPVVFFAVAVVLMMIAEGVARTFARFEPLEAYRLDILGSIAGIAAFSVLSFLGAPPIVWGTIAAALLAVLGGARGAVGTVAALVLLGFLLAESVEPTNSWSPYYKVTVVPQGEDAYRIDVNGIPHQAITTAEARRFGEPLYFLPYERRAGGLAARVLVVGAGTGTDVAIALANGAQEVDAVEIDPRLQRIGAELHPDRPYQDPRVRTHIDDGRAFLERHGRRYDLILFALPDSLTLVSGQSQLRLESFLFTRQALAEARSHLAPGGVFAMYNYYRERWLVDRLARTLQEVYGHPPCLDIGGLANFALLTIGYEPGDAVCAQVWAAQSSAVPEPVSDDYPFLYLRDRGVPPIYLGALTLIALASVALIRGVSGPLRALRPYADLFLMGAAFLLLETKSVVQFSLLFGTTWFVNALVFVGILLSVLGAIEVARRRPASPPGLLYGALGVALALAYLLPLERLLVLPVGLRFVVAVSVAFAPIFFANLIFAERFKDAAASTVAFAANLLGAMTGGLLEYMSLLTGYRTLLIVIGLLYLGAFTLERRAVLKSG
jgi:SAM-dependent methyltransferase